MCVLEKLSQEAGKRGGGQEAEQRKGKRAKKRKSAHGLTCALVSLHGASRSCVESDSRMSPSMHSEGLCAHRSR